MRAKADGLIEACLSLSKVVEAVGSMKSGVSRIKTRPWVKGEEVTGKGDFRKGRKEPAFKPRQAAWLKEPSMANPFKTASQLKRQGLLGRKDAKKALLTPMMVEARLAWCEHHKD